MTSGVIGTRGSGTVDREKKQRGDFRARVVLGLTGTPLRKVTPGGVLSVSVKNGS